MLFSHKAVSVIEFWKYDDNFRRVMLCLESQNAISGKLIQIQFSHPPASCFTSQMSIE